ncbi:hypothetical protein CCH79_00012393, partial [Gambusia affinis]
MAKKKPEENLKHISSHKSSAVREKPEKRKEMKQPKQANIFLLPVIVIVIAICVGPLMAEISAPDFSHHEHVALKMDEALLMVSNELETEVLVSWRSERCYQCLYQHLGVVPAGSSPGQPSSTNFTVNTWHEITLQLNSTHEAQELCKVQFHFGEHGSYSLWMQNLNNVSLTNCSLLTNSDPVNSHMPILVAFFVFVGLALIFAIGCRVLRLGVVRAFVLRMSGTMETERLINSNIIKFTCKLTPTIQELGSPRTDALVTDNILLTPANTNRRLRSLDTFRGMSLVIMVFVNYGGGRYWFFRHSSWNGLCSSWAHPSHSLSTHCSVWERVVSICSRKLYGGAPSCFSLESSSLTQTTVLDRLFIYSTVSLDNLRIPGVLQRLAWSYLVVASLDLLVARGHLDILTTDAWWSPGLDIILYWPAWLCVLLLEILWLCLTFLLPVPDCPTGYLGPGGLGDMGLHVNCTGGAAGYIDRMLLGEQHIYQSPSSKVIYATKMPYDPEGVLGSINSVLMAFLGLQGAISVVLTECSTDKGFIPVNKNLWSLSYVTTLACFAFVLLVLIYYTVDVKKWWSGAPFYYPGMNSILVYVGHEVFENYFPFRWKMANNQSHAEHLIQN